jgi:hypothetical protein
MDAETNESLISFRSSLPPHTAPPHRKTPLTHQPIVKARDKTVEGRESSNMMCYDEKIRKKKMLKSD